MLFLKHDAPAHLARIVKEFWVVENPDPVPQQQKIVPDGYGEIIIHYGDPYRIKLHDEWQVQEKLLLSGQISKYFYLENTSASGMLGIKLMPVATYALFNADIPKLTDRVIPLHNVTDQQPPQEILSPGLVPEERVPYAQRWVEELVVNIEFEKVSRIAHITQQIIDLKGLVDIEGLARENNITRRHLEREFKKIVGLTPKYFSRIIQFNYIFEALQASDNSWVDVALNSGYFDQSHFIKNFKAFTGESPSQYGFDEKNMANFFLRK